jgi:hypothetical protein
MVTIDTINDIFNFIAYPLYYGVNKPPCAYIVDNDLQKSLLVQGS